MSIGFPPVPVYPTGIDSDYTLFKVYNTAEAPLAASNPAWAEEVQIVPVGNDEPELWADNGFANLAGELFYYDAVSKNAAGKVYKLKRCIRNLGGKATRSNPAGTMVRGFVIAEHHNQLVDAILKVEDFLLDDLEPRIQQLQEEPDCIDDNDCPTVSFEFEIDPASNNCEGIVANFNVNINGAFNRFEIDFGDGNTTTALSGTHIYAPNAIIDPVVNIANDKCTIILTPSERDNPQPPPDPTPNEPYDIPIPVIPDFPQIVIPSCTLPETTLTMPQIVFPCLDVGPIGPVQIPSVIVVEPPINIPSVIEITPVDIPSVITIDPASFPTSISIEPFPTQIFVDPLDFPDHITVDPLVFPDHITVDPLDFPDHITVDPLEFPDHITVDPLDFPDHITVDPLDFPTHIEVDPLDFPTEISLNTDGLDQLSDISLIVPDIPTEINVIVPEIPTEISLTVPEIPNPTLIVPDIPDINVTIPEIPPISIVVPSIPDISLIVPSIPNISLIVPRIPNISLIVPSIPNISVIGLRDIRLIADPINININVGVDALSGEVTVVCASTTPSGGDEGGGGGPDNWNSDTNGDGVGGDGFMALGLNQTFQDDLAVATVGEVKSNLRMVIPSEIKLLVPDIPDVRMVHDLPDTISVVGMEIPDKVELVAPNVHLPERIQIIGPLTPLPSSIQILAEDLPDRIELDVSGLPAAIMLEVPDDFPTTIKLDASAVPTTIQVVGIPDHIELRGTIPSEITIRAPENLEVPLVYKGGPIQVQMDMKALTGEDGQELPCFAIVPCPRK